eukprot:TRINITY_DN76247_c0_g1_i1.p1 TRINITY_DN76247_c0_g1~~TRINITY_DN76247_c0_g1_i1.p1  ORF type:complete len:403 (-),score=43.64 TRINITY_DN76247_c0_g1_i1:126-1268(-)
MLAVVSRCSRISCFVAVCFAGYLHCARGFHFVSSQASTKFEEGNYVVRADPDFAQRCLIDWQDECQKSFHHDDELRKRLCETELQRSFVQIRTLVPQQDILDKWKWEKKRRDYDVGTFRHVLPKFTTSGFQKTQLPHDLHRGLQAWYQRNKHRSVPEAQSAFGVYCENGHDNDDWVVSFEPETDDDRRNFAATQEWIRSALSNWTGTDVNEHTVTYGARQYHRGSVCGMHTDNKETHAVSAIYQLDQKGMDEPWALDFVTHQGAEGKAFLNPGDVMLYESAAGLHGRKSPLRGDQFTNVFFHFRSSDWLPKVNSIVKDYWPEREAFVQRTGHQLTSLADAPAIERQLTATDRCLPFRSLENPLMPGGGFMETPMTTSYEA